MLRLAVLSNPSIPEEGHNLPCADDAFFDLVGKTSPPGMCRTHATFHGRRRDFVGWRSELVGRRDKRETLCRP